MKKRYYDFKIESLKREYLKLLPGKKELLKLILETELPEQIYNSNAIENSTLNIKETERILLEMETERDISLREVFEAKNLARISNYLNKDNLSMKIDIELILLLHNMLIQNINDDIAGRFRKTNEYVKVGTFIAPPPEHLDKLINEALLEYNADINTLVIDRIVKFHLEFEKIHPFVDGNGRIGRVLINLQLQLSGLPPIIIRNKGKQVYYKSFQEYEDSGKVQKMSRHLKLAIMESFHKRLAYMKSLKIVKLSEYSKTKEKSQSSLLNAAKRQTIPAFREKGVWKIGVKI